MRKDIALPVLAAAGGAAGFFLRRWQLAAAYDPGTGLFAHGAPATFALLTLFVLLALAFLLLTRRGKEGADDFLPAFGCPGAGQMTALAAACFLMFAAGGLGLLEGVRGLRLWQADPSAYQMSVPGSRLLAGGLCILAGFGILLMGRMAYRGELNGAACFLAPFPALAGLVWLFSTHLEYGTEPVLMKYGVQLFAALALTLAHYYAAGFLYGRPRPRRTLFFGLTGVALGITSLADRPGLFHAAAAVAFSLSAAALSTSLLGGPWPERMPPPEEEEIMDA